MKEFMSPKYQINLINKIIDKLWDDFKSTEDVEYYIEKWHELGDDFLLVENFFIYKYDDGDFDLKRTLNNMDGEYILKIAVDIGVETPNFIPSIPTFKNYIIEDYHNVYDTFLEALKNIEEKPDYAIGIANSAFESLIKEILKEDEIASKLNGKETLNKLTKEILKEFNISDKNFPTEAKTISTSLLSLSQSIEKLRSEKTNFHGKTRDDVVIDDSIYTYLVINSISTVGIFLNSYYKKKYKVSNEDSTDINE